MKLKEGKQLKKPPKNILSYTQGKIFTGREIKEWIQYHTVNQTSKSNIAQKLKKYSYLEDNQLYRITKDGSSFEFIELTPQNRFQIFKTSTFL